MAETSKEKQFIPKRRTIYIDGTKYIMGRLATYAAKAALEGKDVVIFNSEKIVVTGKKEVVFKLYKDRIKDIGGRHKGPFWPRRADDITRKAIKRMLPHQKTRGTEALKRIKTYLGMPKEFESMEKTEFPKAKLKPIEHTFVTLGALSKHLGGKHD